LIFYKDSKKIVICATREESATFVPANNLTPDAIKTSLGAFLENVYSLKSTEGSRLFLRHLKPYRAI